MFFQIYDIFKTKMNEIELKNVSRLIRLNTLVFLKVNPERES